MCRCMGGWYARAWVQAAANGRHGGRGAAYPIRVGATPYFHISIKTSLVTVLTRKRRSASTTCDMGRSGADGEQTQEVQQR